MDRCEDQGRAARGAGGGFGKGHDAGAGPGRARPGAAARPSRIAAWALALTLSGAGLAGLLAPGDAVAKDAAKGGVSTRSSAGTVTGDETDEGGATAKGDGTAPALEVNPADITANSLISRHQAAPRDPNKGPVTNLPLPRYVSLKGGEGNARRGPSLSHRIDWVFRHPGMPLRVVAEFGHWRRVEDQDGAGGWVHYSLLSGVRTAIVMTDMAELKSRADQNATVIARAEAGAIVRLHECTKDWCRVSGGGEKGWVPKTSLWGVDATETRD